MAAKSKSNELKLTRVYDAPVKAVWDAWTDPSQVAQWWGPRGFTLTHHSKDLKPGGHWHYTMHGPDGTDYENTTTYHEVEKYSRLVYDHGGHKDRPPLFRVTVNFVDLKGKTKLDFTMAFATPEVAEETKKFIKKAGGEGTWDRLAEYLEKELNGTEKFVIVRSFDAPIETMFDMWTKKEHFSKWLPPTGFTMEFRRADIRQGGSSFYSMGNGQGMMMYGRANYLEVKRPDRIVYTQQFCDKDEKPSRHPMMPTYPSTVLTTVTLEEEGPDRTRVKVEWKPFEATAEEIAAFVKIRAGMTMGWTGSFDKLEELLAK